MASKYTPDSRLADVRVRGSKLHANIREATTLASISLSTTSPVTMNLTVDDPQMTLMAGGLLTRGASLDYADLELQIRSVDANDPGTGNVVALTARSEAWVRLKNQRGWKLWKNTSPASVVRTLGRGVGMKVVAQSSGKRRRITRGKKESSQGLIERYAGELNFLTFATGDTIYFGSPKWLARNGPKRTMQWDRFNRRGTVSAGGTLLRQPSLRRAEDSPRGQAEMTALFLGDGAETWRPGQVIDFAGAPGFSGRYLVNDVQIPGDANEPVSVTAAIPTSLKGSSGDALLRSEGKATSGTAALTLGAPPSTTFTDAAMTYAVGSTGTAVGGSAVQPFTGAEMVNWCAGRAGVSLVGDPAQMLAFCRSRKTTISVGDGVTTRGALLFTTGAVGIAIGGGRVVMASGRAYTIVPAGAVSWTAAALVPGLKYGR